MPTFLLSAIPIWLRLLFIAAMVIGLFGYGFRQGAAWENTQWEAKTAETLAKERNEAAKLNKELGEQLFAAESSRRKAEEEAIAAKGKLAAALAKKPELSSKACELPKEAIDSINELVGGGWRNKK